MIYRDIAKQVPGRSINSLSDRYTVYLAANAEGKDANA